MNLQISPFCNNNFNLLKNSCKVSFGEYDGDDYSFSAPRISKADYNIKKNLINEKYDQKRSSFLQDADDLEFSSAEVWKQLANIEKMRETELGKLETDYRV